MLVLTPAKEVSSLVEEGIMRVLMVLNALMLMNVKVECIAVEKDKSVRTYLGAIAAIARVVISTTLSAEHALMLMNVGATRAGSAHILARIPQGPITAPAARDSNWLLMARTVKMSMNVRAQCVVKNAPISTALTNAIADRDTSSVNKMATPVRISMSAPKVEAQSVCSAA